MIRLVQVVPAAKVRLFDLMTRKENELSRRGVGTFRRTGRKAKNRATWSHVRYEGRIDLARVGGGITAKIRTAGRAANRWQLLHAFIGWLDRHFGDQIQLFTVHYKKS